MLRFTPLVPRLIAIAMRHGFSTTSLVIVATVALGYWSTASADSSFKLVTAPSDAKQAPTVTEGSSFKVVTAPSDVKQAPTANEGSSFKVVTPPTQQAQAQPPSGPGVAGPPPPGAEDPPPGAGEQQMINGIAITLPEAQQVRIPTHTSRRVTFSEPFTAIYPLSSAFVDVVPITDHSVILKGSNQGIADIYFTRNGEVTHVLSVSVDDFNYKIPNPKNDPDVAAYGYVDLHNKSLLDSQTHFRCRWNDCKYTGESTVSEPAPLPAGYSNSTSSIGYSGLPGEPGVVPPAPAVTPPRQQQQH